MKTEFEYSPELFTLASKEDRNAERIRRPSIKYWPDVWRRLKMNKLAMTGLVLIILFAVMSFVGTQMNGFKYFEQDYSKINLHPNKIYNLTRINTENNRNFDILYL